jgi:crotonobetainyl-CoA:carnitine CoA-transferase CaiB-like acyl-CoA transferase
VAMTDVVTSLNIMNIAAALAQKVGKGMTPFNIQGTSLCYNVFKTKDGKFVSVGDIEGKFWENFCKAVGRTDLADKPYAAYQQGDKNTEVLKEIFAGKTQAEWVEFMKKVDDCFAPVLTPEEVLEDPHLVSRGMITKVKDPRRGDTVQIGFPAQFAQELNYQRSPAPVLGENTDEILQALGYRRQEIEDLKKDGTV